MEVIRKHAQEFVANRLSAENPVNDGKQTPGKGHPVFVVQHATACCCRGCLEKWHHKPAGKVLTKEEQEYIVEAFRELELDEYSRRAKELYGNTPEYKEMETGPNERKV